MYICYLVGGRDGHPVSKPTFYIWEIPYLISSGVLLKVYQPAMKGGETQFAHFYGVDSPTVADFQLST